MERIRSTFRRTKSPPSSSSTPAETASRHLEVSKHIRSVSIDETKLKGKFGRASARYLEVPLSEFGAVSGSGRSRSLDAYSLDGPCDCAASPKRQTIPSCVHCFYLSETAKLEATPAAVACSSSQESVRSNSSSSDGRGGASDGDEFPFPETSPVVVTLTPNSPSASPPMQEARGPSGRRSSNNFPKLERQLAQEGDWNDEDSFFPHSKSDSFYLEVPSFSSKNRSASFEIFLGGNPITHTTSFQDAELLKCSDAKEIHIQPRSKSMDLVFSAEKISRVDVDSLRKANSGEIVQITDENGKVRTLSNLPDWSENACNGDHLWVTTSRTGDLCYVGESDCLKQGQKVKCSACKIVVHIGCLPFFLSKVRFPCKPSFRELRSQDSRVLLHHWVHKSYRNGKCMHCKKGFQSKLFSSKEIVAVACSWCKAAYHTKDSCFTMDKFQEPCSMGSNQNVIIPPSWFVKLPQGAPRPACDPKKPSKRKTNKKKARNEQREHKAFVVIPNSSRPSRPCLIFINPKSGGNQGHKLLQKFQWLLNPRQIFDLSVSGPKAGLEMFAKVPNLRILACGGDGTTGWILSTIDQLRFVSQPAVGTLPLGTGNDLSRSLGWGSGYTDEPISKILKNFEEGELIYLDRWLVEVDKNENAGTPTSEGKDNVPLNVLNNYFSLGVDAQIALDFHQAREANPEKYSSRIRNKMFYGQKGGKDLLQKKWRNLSDHITLVCDGRDLTAKLRELKIHCLLFLNIPSYGSGTHPWNIMCGKPAMDDSLLEVIGLTTYQLTLLQAGAHGTCIAQCRSAYVRTEKVIPVQVDGEACKLNPSVIRISHLNRALLVAKRKKKKQIGVVPLENMRLEVRLVRFDTYEKHCHDKDILRKIARKLGVIYVNLDCDLEQARAFVLNLGNEASLALEDDWCFLDSYTADRFFRIDQNQENFHYVSDICDLNNHQLFILNTQTSSEIKNFSSEEGMQDFLRQTLEDLPEKGEQTNRPDGEEEEDVDELLECAKRGDVHRIRDLHQAGRKLTVVDTLGKSILHHATVHGHTDVVQYVVAHTPSSFLDVTDFHEGRTALHMAASSRQRSICCILIAAGASLLFPDASQKIPRELAEDACDKELANYLINQERFQRNASENIETII